MKDVILILGVPGSGKTTLSSMLKNMLPHCMHLNADEIRSKFNDWDFSEQGRLRQCNRMKQLANEAASKFVICDFVCPKIEFRKQFNASYIIWCNTIDEGRYSDTNKLFEVPLPSDCNLIVSEFDKMKDAAMQVQNYFFYKYISEESSISL
jgi:adenylylsulfate kinase